MLKLESSELLYAMKKRKNKNDMNESYNAQKLKR